MLLLAEIAVARRMPDSMGASFAVTFVAVEARVNVGVVPFGVLRAEMLRYRSAAAPATSALRNAVLLNELLMSSMKSMFSCSRSFTALAQGYCSACVAGLLAA